MIRFAVSTLVCALTPAAAAEKEITFIGVSTSGKPVEGRVIRRNPAGQLETIGNLDPTGRRKLSPVECTPGVQFKAESRHPIFVSSGDWADCAYGEVKFVFGELSWSTAYLQGLWKLDDLAKNGPAAVRLEAIVAANSFSAGDFGKAALATNQLLEKLGDDPAQRNLKVLELDAVSRSIGVAVGLKPGPEGTFVFSDQSLAKFKELSASGVLPDVKTIDDKALKGFIAKQDYLNTLNRGGLIANQTWIRG